MLTFIETLGLRESQEKSAKDIFRDVFYSVLYQQTLWVSGEMLSPVAQAAFDEARTMNSQPQWSRHLTTPVGK